MSPKDAVTITLSREEAAKVLNKGVGVTILETTTPVKSAIEVLTMHPGAAIVMDYSTPDDLDRGLIVGTEVPQELSDRMMIVVTEASEAGKDEIVKDFLMLAKTFELPTYIIGSPADVWITLATIKDLEVSAVFSALSEVTRGRYGNLDDLRTAGVATVDIDPVSSKGNITAVFAHPIIPTYPRRAALDIFKMCWIDLPVIIQ